MLIHATLAPAVEAASIEMVEWLQNSGATDHNISSGAGESMTVQVCVHEAPEIFASLKIRSAVVQITRLSDRGITFLISKERAETANAPIDGDVYVFCPMSNVAYLLL